MNQERRLDRLSDRLAPEDEYKPTPELDAEIERGFEAIRRNFPDKGEEMIAAIIAESLAEQAAQTRTNTDSGQ